MNAQGNDEHASAIIKPGMYQGYLLTTSLWDAARSMYRLADLMQLTVAKQNDIVLWTCISIDKSASM